MTLRFLYLNVLPQSPCDSGRKPSPARSFSCPTRGTWHIVRTVREESRRGVSATGHRVGRSGATYQRVWALQGRQLLRRENRGLGFRRRWLVLRT